MKIVGHISDAFANIVDGLMLEWNYHQMIDKAVGKNRILGQVTTVTGVKIKIPYIFCMRQSFIKVIYEKKSINVKQI